MIKVKVTALIHQISQVIEVPNQNGGQPFRKRELVLNEKWERNGEQFNNFIVIEFSGDKMIQLDNFVPGQLVAVEAFVNGRDSKGKFFNTIKGQSIAIYQPRQNAGYAPRSAGYPSPNQPPQGNAYSSAAQPPYGQPQQQYPRQGYAAQQGQPQGYPQTGKYPQLGVNDLPFEHGG